MSAIVLGGSGGEIAEVYINRGAARISSKKARGTLGRKKWKWKKKKWGKWKLKMGGRFFSNLAQEEAIFLVLVCQINVAFQIFISLLVCGDIRVTVFITRQGKKN